MGEIEKQTGFTSLRVDRRLLKDCLENSSKHIDKDQIINDVTDYIATYNDSVTRYFNAIRNLTDLNKTLHTDHDNIISETMNLHKTYATNKQKKDTAAGEIITKTQEIFEQLNWWRENASTCVQVRINVNDNKSHTVSIN